MRQLKPGDYLYVKTRTQDDVFGHVLYEIVEVGLPSPERDRNKQDGIKAVIVTGTGLAARKGYPVLDSEQAVLRNIEEGITQILTREQGCAMVSAIRKGG